VMHHRVERERSHREALRDRSEQGQTGGQSHVGLAKLKSGSFDWSHVLRWLKGVFFARGQLDDRASKHYRPWSFREQQYSHEVRGVRPVKSAILKLDYS